jgi:hypothetical protein
VPCAKVKQRCVGVRWVGNIAGLSGDSERRPSEDVEVVEALAEIVKVLKGLRRELVTSLGEIVNAIDKECVPTAEESEVDSDKDLEMEMDKHMGMVEEATNYQAWLAEMGRLDGSLSEEEEEEEEENEKEKEDEEVPE